MFDPEILNSASDLVKKTIGLGMWITTAESCTGGLIAGALTSVSGASECMGAGYVTYSNDAKINALGVLEDSLKKYGAVSKEVAGEMAMGAKLAANADIALAVTGIAGPNGGTIDKPVGLVYIAVAGGINPDNILVNEFHYGNIGRIQVRRETVLSALKLGHKALLNAS